MEKEVKTFRCILGDDACIELSTNGSLVVRNNKSKKEWSNVVKSHFAFNIYYLDNVKEKKCGYRDYIISEDLFSFYDAIAEAIMCNKQEYISNPDPLTTDWDIKANSVVRKNGNGEIEEESLYDITFFRNIGAKLGFRLPPLFKKDLLKIEKTLREFFQCMIENSITEAEYIRLNKGGEK